MLIIRVKGGGNSGKSSAIYNAYIRFLLQDSTTLYVKTDNDYDHNFNINGVDGHKVYGSKQESICFCMAADEEPIVQANIAYAKQNNADVLVGALNTDKKKCGVWWDSALATAGIKYSYVDIEINNMTSTKYRAVEIEIARIVNQILQELNKHI